MTKALFKPQKSAVMTSWLNDNGAAISAAMPDHVKPDHLFRTMIQAIAGNDKLQKCTNRSLIGAMVQSAVLGLECNGLLGEAYMVPFYNNKIGKNECVLMPSYKGLIKLAINTGMVSKVYAHVVHLGDEFDVQLGTDPKIHHVPLYGVYDDCVPSHVYAVYKTPDGQEDFEVLMWEEVEKIRSGSKAKDGDPWTKWTEEMAKKTAIRRLLKRAPMSVHLAKAVKADTNAAIGESPDYEDDIHDVVAEIVIPDDEQSQIEGGK